jgi:hypothetical protein
MESSSNWRSGRTGQQMKQLGLNDAGFTRYPKKTRKAHFLDEMDRVVPWFRLITLIEPHYPKAGRGRRPIALETMLRIHFMQHWFAFSDPVKGSRHEKLATRVRQFVPVLGCFRVPRVRIFKGLRAIFRRVLWWHAGDVSCFY